MRGHFLSLLLVLPLVSAPLSGQNAAYDEAVADAELLMVEKDYRAAVKAFKKAQKLAGGSSFECCYGLAHSFFRLGAYSNAVDSARQALDLAGSPEEELGAHHVMGLGLFAGGDADRKGLQEAARSFQRVLELNRGLPADRRQPDGLVRYNLGVTLLKLERDDEGVELLREFLASDPTGTEAEKARTYVDDPRRARVALMPELEVVTLDGEYLTSEDLLGKVVLIDFWGTWCPPCVASIPHLRRLSKRIQKSPFMLLSISNDGDDGVLRRFVAEHGMTWPQVWDEDRRLTGRIFQIKSYPTFVLVDHEGVVIYRQSGWGDAIGRALDTQIARAVRVAKKAAGQ